MALAGLLSACRLKGETLADQRFVVVGAGAGGVGVAWAIKQGLLAAGLSEPEAHARLLIVDREGLLVQGQNLEPHQVAYAQPPEALRGWTFSGEIPTLLETIQNSGATALLGLSGVGGLFTQPIVAAVAHNAARPIVFPLSNPTSNVEALPEDVLRWTGWQAIVATGSPFGDVTHEGVTYRVGQGNNAFIFPGLGFGAILSRAREITDGMVLEAARTLAECTDLSQGRVYPHVSELNEVSVRVATRVVLRAVQDGVAAEYRLRSLGEEAVEAYARERFWTPRYLPFQKR
jgi:malate dehydrogenase (oxaloacetate-decarboxylating)/malate dehydrogenase (oxaloacetate-decarboxylating)(NADP+)